MTIAKEIHLSRKTGDAQIVRFGKEYVSLHQLLTSKNAEDPQLDMEKAKTDFNKGKSEINGLYNKLYKGIVERKAAINILADEIKRIYGHSVHNIRMLNRVLKNRREA